MLAVIGFLRSQIAEIERDSALRWYGVAMAFLHVVTYLYWVDQRVVTFVHAQAEPICWPLLPECEKLRVLSAAGVGLLLRAYFAAAGALGVRGPRARESPQARRHAARLSLAHESALHGVLRDVRVPARPRQARRAPRAGHALLLLGRHAPAQLGMDFGRRPLS